MVDDAHTQVVTYPVMSRVQQPGWPVAGGRAGPGRCPSERGHFRFHRRTNPAHYYRSHNYTIASLLAFGCARRHGMHTNRTFI